MEMCKATRSVCYSLHGLSKKKDETLFIYFLFTKKPPNNYSGLSDVWQLVHHFEPNRTSLNTLPLLCAVHVLICCEYYSKISSHHHGSMDYYSFLFFKSETYNLAMKYAILKPKWDLEKRGTAPVGDKVAPFSFCSHRGQLSCSGFDLKLSCCPWSWSTKRWIENPANT